MNREERIEVLTALYDARLKACDSLLQAAQEYAVARKNFRDMIPKITDDRIGDFKKIAKELEDGKMDENEFIHEHNKIKDEWNMDYDADVPLLKKIKMLNSMEWKF
jgi:hypothetical protein